MSIHIRYITPFASDLNIGGAYNKAISELPDDCFVCIRDGDTMFLTSDWGKQIEQIIADNPKFDLIGCMTNRLGIDDQIVLSAFDCDSLFSHIEVAERFKLAGGSLVTETYQIAAMLMIFHKSVWQKAGGFKENSIIFDKQFCKSVKAKGMSIGIARGLYLLHLYRYGKDKPQQYTDHLRVSKKPSY